MITQSHRASNYSMDEISLMPVDKVYKAMQTAALGAVRLTAGLTGIALGLNLWNALVIAVLGLPGFVLLLLVQWIL